MDKYVRVNKKIDQHFAENEIRCSAKGRAGNYISYALKLFKE